MYGSHKTFPNKPSDIYHGHPTFGILSCGKIYKFDWTLQLSNTIEGCDEGLQRTH